MHRLETRGSAYAPALGSPTSPRALVRAIPMWPGAGAGDGLIMGGKMRGPHSTRSLWAFTMLQGM